MMNSTLKNLSNLQAGTVIEGKWHRKKYSLVKELGCGANGVVYLAEDHNQRPVAIKLSYNGLSITSEVNVLKSFAKVQGSTLGPSLIDVDDWMRPTGKVCFYVMEYIKGPTLLEFVSGKADTWVEVLMLQLLSDLHLLHENGWVFGDLKPENLIVTGRTPRIRCIDVGGTTLQGRAIKEYTEFYDRGYWGLGSRKAERTYDLFAVAMIFINTVYPKRFPKTSGGLTQLREMIRQKPSLANYEPVLVQALQGRYHTALEMRRAILDGKSQPAAGSGSSRSQTNQVGKQPKPASSSRQPSTKIQQPKKRTATVNRQVLVKRKRKHGLVETAVIFLTITFCYFLYIFVQL